MKHKIELLTLEERVDRGGISDVSLPEGYAAALNEIGDVLQVAGVCQKVEGSDLPRRALLGYIVNEIAADKSRSSGNENLHRNPSII
jgi:hypothetical protein